MKTLIFAALIVSILLVFTVGAALAAPGNPGPQLWSGKDGGNVWQAHDGAVGDIESGRDWGAAVSSFRAGK